MYEASTIIQSAAHEDANIIFGAVLDEKMKDEVKITVIATGFRSEAQRSSRDTMTSTSAAIQQARQAHWAPPPEPQITRRADVAYESQVEPVESRDAQKSAPSVSRVPVDEPAVEAPQPPVPPPTRIWEAVQPTRPAPSLEALSAEDERDELDVPAYLRKKNSDLS